MKRVSSNATAVKRVSEMSVEELATQMTSLWRRIGPEILSEVSPLNRADVVEIVMDSLPLILDDPGKLNTAGRKAFPNLIYCL